MKKKSHSNNFVNKNICAIILFIMCFVVLTKVGVLFLVEKMNIDNKIVRFICDLPNEPKSYNVNWKEIYPFNDNTNSGDKKNIVDKYTNKIYDIESKIENNCTDNLFKYSYIAECGNKLEKALGWNLYRNASGSTIDIGDEYLIKLTRLIPKEELSLAPKNLIDFSKYVEEKNINFLYVQAPYKLDEETKVIDNIYNDYANENVNNFINILKNKNVNLLDLRKYMPDDSRNYKNMFFKTDHHWLPSSGLWASSIISEYLNENFKYNIDTHIFDEDNYNFELKKDCFLGSAGRAATLARAKKEDFEVIEPNFETSLDVNVEQYKVNLHNSTWRKALINNDILNEEGNPYLIDRYASYGYSNAQKIYIKNNKVNNDNKVLIIKDSFANCTVPYFCLGIKETLVLDLRYFNGSVKSVIEEYNPNTVIVMYNCAAINDDNTVMKGQENHNNFWDFE